MIEFFSLVFSQQIRVGINVKGTSLRISRSLLWQDPNNGYKALINLMIPKRLTIIQPFLSEQIDNPSFSSIHRLDHLKSPFCCCSNPTCHRVTLWLSQHDLKRAPLVSASKTLLPPQPQPTLIWSWLSTIPYFQILVNVESTRSASSVRGLLDGLASCWIPKLRPGYLVQADMALGPQIMVADMTLGPGANRRFTCDMQTSCQYN